MSATHAEIKCNCMRDKCNKLLKKKSYIIVSLFLIVRTVVKIAASWDTAGVKEDWKRFAVEQEVFCINLLSYLVVLVDLVFLSKNSCSVRHSSGK